MYTYVEWFHCYIVRLDIFVYIQISTNIGNYTYVHEIVIVFNYIFCHLFFFGMLHVNKKTSWFWFFKKPKMKMKKKNPDIYFCNFDVFLFSYLKAEQGACDL